MAFLKRKGFGKFHARLPQKLSFPKRSANKLSGNDSVDAVTNIVRAEKITPNQISTSTAELNESATVITDIISANNDDAEARCEVEATEEKHKEEERDTDGASLNDCSTEVMKTHERKDESYSIVQEFARRNLEMGLSEELAAKEGNLKVTRSRSCSLPCVPQAFPCALRTSRSLPIRWKTDDAVALADMPKESKSHGNEADGMAVPVGSIGGSKNLGANTFDSLCFSWDNDLKQSCSTMTDTLASHSFQKDFLQSHSYGTTGTTSTDVTSVFLELARSLDDRLAGIAHHGMALVASISEGLENVDVKSLYEDALLKTNKELARVRHDLRESANMSAKELALGVSTATDLGSDRIKLTKLTEIIVARYLRAVSDLANRFERATKTSISHSSTLMEAHFNLLNLYLDCCHQIGNVMIKDAADLINSINEEDGCEVVEPSLAHFPTKDISTKESQPMGECEVYLNTTNNGEASIPGTYSSTLNCKQVVEMNTDKLADSFAYKIPKTVELGSEELCKLKKMIDDTTMNCYRKASDMFGKINCILKGMATQSAAEMNEHCESWKYFTKEKSNELIDRATNTTVDEKGYEVLLSTVADYSVNSIPTESRPIGGPKYYIKARKGDARIVSFVSDCT